MKTSHLIPYLMTIAVITGCIKEDGEPYTIERQIDKKTNLVSSLNGYMYGNASTDVITKDTFELFFNNRNIQDLDVYLGLKSKFYVYDTSRIVQCGYVYSYTDEMPTITKKDCEVFEEVTWNKDNNHDSITFEGEQHKLQFHTDVHIRSFVVNQNGDTCYNPQVLTHKTSMPSDVWYQRNDAPGLFHAREGIITATTDNGTTYFYGGRGTTDCYSDMWVYDVTKDTWEQKCTFNPSDAHTYSSPVERCYGAAFTYYNTTTNDTLMYIIGGEDASGTATKFNFIYSIKNNRFGYHADHPNGRQYVEPLDNPRTGMIAFNVESPSGETVHVVGMGMFKDEMSSIEAVEPKLFYYDVVKDKLTPNPETNEDDGTHIYTWKTFGSVSKEGVLGDKAAIGFHQSVAVKINKNTVIVGSGEDSDDNFGRVFYEIKSNKASEIECKQLPLPPEGFKARKNATAFYLEYNHLGGTYSKFYVGTGVDKDGNLLNDFWAYDLANGTWSQIRDCSNILRQGAVGFSILRVDDLVDKGAEPQQRGIVAFGKGVQIGGDGGYTVRNDVWEYLP